MPRESISAGDPTMKEATDHQGQQKKSGARLGDSVFIGKVETTAVNLDGKVWGPECRIARRVSWECELDSGRIKSNDVVRAGD